MDRGPRSPHLVVVTHRQSYRTTAFLDAAVQMGCRVTVVTDADVALPGSAIVVDPAVPAGVARAVARRLTEPPDGVVATDGPAVVAAATLARSYGLVTSRPQAVRRAVDKHGQRRAAQDHDLRQPRWTVVRPGEPCRGPAAGPLVVKPVDRSGGQGVIRVESVADGEAAIARVRRIVGEAPVLVEQFVAGREVAVEALVVRGELRVVAVFDQPDAGTGPFFAETLLVQPGRLTDAERTALFALVRDVVAAVGLTEGSVHLEARIDEVGRPWFIEMAPRSIGGLCSGVLRPAGRSLEEVLVTAALGGPVPAVLAHDGPATGVHMIPVPRAGVLRGVDGVDRARAVPGVTGVEITAAAGSRLEPLPERGGYIGFVFAQADDTARVEAALRTAAGALEVIVSGSGSV